MYKVILPVAFLGLAIVSVAGGFIDKGLAIVLWILAMLITLGVRGFIDVIVDAAMLVVIVLRGIFRVVMGVVMILEGIGR